MKSLIFYRSIGFVLIAVGFYKLYEAFVLSSDLKLVSFVTGLVMIILGFVTDNLITWINGAVQADIANRKKYPDQPWMWRLDWRKNTVEPNELKMYNFSFKFFILWILLTCPTTILVLLTKDVHNNPALYFLLVFPLVGVAVLNTAFKQRKKINRLKEIKFYFEKHGVIGEEFQGEVVIPMKKGLVSTKNHPCFPAFDVILKNISSRYLGGEGQSVITNTIWQSEIKVKPILEKDFISLPVKFVIPLDVKPYFFELETGPSANTKGLVILWNENIKKTKGDNYTWRLQVITSEDPKDLDITFDVPIFNK